MTHTTAAIELVGRPSRIKTRLGLILGAHVVIDVYSAYVPPLLGMLEVRCHLSPAQTAMILGLGSVSSGLSQPLSAWLSDRTDSRMFGGLGLLLAAICLSCIGMASSMASLAAIYVLGMVGVGIFHPIGASSIGQLSDALPRARRSLGISLFFVAGMAGGISGSILAPRLAAQPGGFELLRYTMIPGLFVAGALHLAIARISHHEHHRVAAVLSAADIARRWKLVALLYLSNAMRFTVNMTLLYLFVRWRKRR